MTPVSQLLAKVTITENSTRLTRRLDRVGFTNRKKSSGFGQLVTHDEIMKRRPITLDQVLATYGIHDNCAMMELDRMPIDIGDARTYPAELVAGIEIYRHNVPVDAPHTRGGRLTFDRQLNTCITRPLVLVWTYIP